MGKRRQKISNAHHEKSVLRNEYSFVLSEIMCIEDGSWSWTGFDGPISHNGCERMENSVSYSTTKNAIQLPKVKGTSRRYI